MSEQNKERDYLLVEVEDLFKKYQILINNKEEFVNIKRYVLNTYGETAEIKKVLLVNIKEQSTLFEA